MAAPEVLLTTDLPVESAPKPGQFAAIHPLLFAAYPVLFLWSQNLGETDPADVVLPLVVLVGVAAIATFAARPRVRRPPPRGADRHSPRCSAC